jgi:hypothetical protein
MQMLNKLPESSKISPQAVLYKQRLLTKLYGKRYCKQKKTKTRTQTPREETQTHTFSLTHKHSDWRLVHSELKEIIMRGR